MRCLSIADALAELHEQVVFITADAYGRQLIEDRGFAVICLDSRWNDMESETEKIIPELNRLSPDLLLVDSYQVTPRYMESLRENVTLAYIDDLNAFDYPADIVINYSVYAEDISYPQNKRYLLGTKYAPLRRQFDISEEVLEAAAAKRARNRQILITTGASDPYHVTDKTVNAIINEPALDDYSIAVIRGRFFDNDMTGIHPDRVRIYENVENMADLMLESTMAVSAGGSTLYELCACHVPTVTFSYADNQLGNVTGFDRRGIMPYAGDATNDNDLGKQITQNLLKFHNNPEAQTSVINKMRSLDCGKGAAHLARCVKGTVLFDNFSQFVMV